MKPGAGSGINQADRTGTVDYGVDQIGFYPETHDHLLISKWAFGFVGNDNRRTHSIRRRK
jgi:hypothetical protein